MFGFNHMELLVFALIVLVLFGSRIPATMRSLGLGIHEFRRGLRSDDDRSLESSPQ